MTDHPGLFEQRALLAGREYIKSRGHWLEADGICAADVDAGSADQSERMRAFLAGAAFAQPPASGVDREAFDALVEEEAAQIAERENACSGCCGSYGTETADDYRDDVRRHFEEIGRAYAALTNSGAPVPGGDLTDRFWLIVRKPGSVPDRKGPWKHSETARVLREFMAANPTAFIDHLTIGDDGTPDVEHGPLVLQYTDGRSMSVGRKHNERVRAAALAASQMPGDAGGAERICREAAQWELAQAAIPGIGKKAADNHRGAAHALEMVADKIAALAAPAPSDESKLQKTQIALEPEAGVPAGMVLDANRIKWFKAAAEFLDYCAGTELEFEGCEHSALAIVEGLHEALFDDEMDMPFHEAVAWCLDLAKQATPTDEAVLGFQRIVDLAEESGSARARMMAMVRVARAAIAARSAPGSGVGDLK